MNRPRRERFFFVVVALVAVAAIAVIAYKAEVIGWSSDSSGKIERVIRAAG